MISIYTMMVRPILRDRYRLQSTRFRLILLTQQNGNSTPLWLSLALFDSLSLTHLTKKYNMTWLNRNLWVACPQMNSLIQSDFDNFLKKKSHCSNHLSILGSLFHLCFPFSNGTHFPDWPDFKWHKYTLFLCHIFCYLYFLSILRRSFRPSSH